MNNESPPESSRRAPGGEFTWPPTREELDAIEVIRLDDTTSIEQRAVVPANAMAGPALARRGRLRLPRRLPRRDDLVFAGALGTSVLAIAVAASMQFSDVLRPAPERLEPAQQTERAELTVLPERQLAPLIAQALPVKSPLVMSPVAATPLAALATDVAPAAPRTVAGTRTRGVSRLGERRRASTSRAATYARRPAAAAYAPRAASNDYARPRLIASEGGRSGKIVLNVEVRKNGKVGDVDVLSSDLDRKNRSHRDLQRAAISAVKRWRYEPAIRDGAPADTRVRVVVDINLDSQRVAFTEANARRRAAAANRAADSVLAAR